MNNTKVIHIASLVGRHVWIYNLLLCIRPINSINRQNLFGGLGTGSHLSSHSPLRRKQQPLLASSLGCRWNYITTCMSSWPRTRCFWRRIAAVGQTLKPLHKPPKRWLQFLACGAALHLALSKNEAFPVHRLCFISKASTMPFLTTFVVGLKVFSTISWNKLLLSCMTFASGDLKAAVSRGRFL